MALARLVSTVLGIAWLALAGPAAMAQGNGHGNGGGGGGGNNGGGGDPAPNAEIAYLQGGDVWVMNADGTNQTMIFDQGSVNWVTWSPDGSRLAINAEINQVFGIWTIAADGSDLQLVKETHWSTYQYDLQWSPVATADGHEKIAFIEVTDWDDPEGSFDVYAINPDGTGLVHLVATPVVFMENCCAWSRDASRIAVYESYSTNSLTVYSLGLVDGELGVVGAEDVPNLPPDIGGIDWARTQNKLAVVSFVEGSSNNYELWTIDLDDPFDRRQLTFFEQVDAGPSWAPDDSFVAYWRSPRPAKQIGIREVTSDGQTDVSLGVKEGYKPDWRR